METEYIIPAVILLVVLITVAKTIVMVPQGFAFTIERLGKFSHVARPGLSFIMPFMDRISHRMNMKEQVFDIPSQSIITRDNAMVTVDGVVFYQVLDPAKAAYEINELRYAILNLSMTNIRTVMGSMDLDELLSHREKINASLLGIIDEATDPWGIKVTRVEIKDITPPRDLVESMGRQMKAERDKRAQILLAEGERQSAILQAEGERQAAILAAEGEKQAAFLESEARERRAEAEAKATTVVSDAIAKGSTHAINYFIATKYTEALKEIGTSPNSKMIFMPLDASGIMSSVGGIAELVKEAVKGK